MPLHVAGEQADPLSGEGEGETGACLVFKLVTTELC